MTVLFMTVGGKATSEVASVVEDSPARTIGLRAGDRLVAINGERVDASDIRSRIADSGGAELVVRVVRDGREIDLAPAKPERIEGGYRLGFVLAGAGLGPVEAIGRAFHVTGIVTVEIGKALGRLTYGEGREDVSSPIGIVQASSDSVERGAENYLWILSLISLSLALLNLLPLLPLDGGHILFSLIEGARGRFVRREVYERVSVVGLALVLLLFFVGLTNDIGNLS